MNLTISKLCLSEIWLAKFSARHELVQAHIPYIFSLWTILAAAFLEYLIIVRIYSSKCMQHADADVAVFWVFEI